MLEERLKYVAGLAVISVLILLTINACTSTSGGAGIIKVDKADDERPPEVRSTGIIGPPPHAPAHGHRRKKYSPDQAKKKKKNKYK